MRFVFRVAVLACATCLTTACAANSSPGTAAPSRDIVTAADIEAAGDQPLEQILARKITGLSVITTSGGGTALVVRGSTALIEGPRTPLYILDDARISTGPEGEFPSLNSKDIDNIKVLKGSAAGIYGIEGANGVIVITTKRAKK